VPPWKQAGLPWCQPTCPVCQWEAALFDLGAHGLATALNAGRWGGDPRRAFSRRHVAGPTPLPPQGGSWRRRTPSLGEGVRAPVAGRSGLACDGPAITRGGPGPPWGDRVHGGYPRALQHSWGRGGPGPRIARGGSGDHSPTCQGRAVCHVPRRQGGDYGLRDAKGLDTLAGGTPIRMYQQRPPGPPWERDEPTGGARSQHCAGWTA
jgi:hypothetical protein